MTRERLDTWCEKGILILVLAILVFGPLATGAVGPSEFLIIQGLTMGSVLLWMARCWLNHGHRLLWPPICWTVVAFVIYAIIRYQQAELEYVARQELIRILVYASVFFVILNNLARQESTLLLSCVLIFLGMAVSMYAVYQFATNSQYVWHFIKPAGYGHRASGTYICPNHLAGFLEMLVPIGLAYTLTGRVGHLLRVFLGYASLALLAGIGVSISRGGWVASGVALLVFSGLLIRRRQHRIPAFIVLALLVLGGIVFYVNARQPRLRIKETFAKDNPKESANFRLSMAKPTIAMWLGHFWSGVGPGQYDDRFPAYRTAEIQARPGYAHNDYLQALAEWGLFGTTLIAVPWALLFAGIFKTWKYVCRDSNILATKPGNRATFVYGASIGLFAILIHSFVDFNMHVPANAILAITLMALLTSCQRFSTERYWIGLNWTVRLLVTSIILTELAFFAQQGWRRAGEHAALEHAAKEKTYSQIMIAALKAAHEIEPMNFETTYAIGEALRQLSWQGYPGYEKLAREAIEWFRRGIQLNPYDPYNYMKIGMCLDWLEQHAEAARYFAEAVNRDPNNYYVLAHQGWHFVQVKDWKEAERWLRCSIKVKWLDNPIALNYLTLIERRLKETDSSR